MHQIKVADAHCDLLYKRFIHDASADVTFDSLKNGNVWIQTLAVFAHAGRFKGYIERACLSQLSDFFKAADELGLKPLGNPPDDKARGERFALLSVEGGEAFAGSLFKAEEYLKKGAKLVGLTWNYENELAFPCGQPGGLKPFGRDVIKLMNAKKAAVDVSHLNKQGFWQALDAADAVCASHSCCSALCGGKRNLSDEQITAIIAKKGFIGINFYPYFLTGNGCAAADDVIRHIAHILYLGGENAVGFGSDFDGIEIKPEGIESPECFPGLVSRLLEIFPRETAEKIAHKNFAAFLERLF